MKRKRENGMEREKRENMKRENGERTESKGVRKRTEKRKKR